MMAGEIMITRTIYKDRITKKHYYLEEKNSICKSQRFTNDVASYVTEEYSDEKSMIKVENKTSNLIHN